MPTLQTVSRQNLLHTPHGFCFRMKVPKRHRDYFHRREFKKSLQTTDLKEAQKRALLLTVQIDDFITRLDILKGYRMSRLPFFSEIKIAEVDVSFAGIKFRGVETDPLHPEAEAKAYREILAAAREEHQGLLKQSPAANVAPSVAEPLDAPTVEVSLPPQISETLASVKPKKLFARLIEDFVEEKTLSGNWKKAASNGRKQQLIRCLEYFGERDISTITRDDAMSFMKVLMRLPLNIKKKKELADKTLAEIADKNKGATLSPKSVNMAMNDVSGFFKWCSHFGHVESNLFEGLSVKETTKALTQRLPYSVPELTKLFNDQTFQLQHCEPSDFFLPLLGLYTGARLNELCQLHTTDVREIADVWVIDINDDDEQKSIKTKDSRRVVPIHPELIRLNFLKYVHQQKPGRVFPNLEFKYGKFSSDYTKRFGTVRRRAKIQDNDFYSFRHLFSAELEKLEIPEHLVASLLGHQHPQITFGRYGEPKHVQRLETIVSQLSFTITVSPWKFQKKIGTALSRNRTKAATALNESNPTVIHRKRDLKDSVDDSHERIFGRSLEAARNH